MADSFKVINDFCWRGDFYRLLLDYYCDADNEEERQYYGNLCATLQCMTRQYAVPEDVSEAAQRRFEMFDSRAAEARWLAFIQSVEATMDSHQLLNLVLQNRVLMQELISGFRDVFVVESSSL